MTVNILNSAINPTISHTIFNVNTNEKISLRDNLKPSVIANHRYCFEGEQFALLHRTICAQGTRVRILNEITTWANDTSAESQTVYWLSGPAGTGKSTIAYTIANNFDLPDDSDGKIVLGGTFFCSRLFPETRLASHIVRTIAYHLAHRCKVFADALNRSGKFDSIYHGVRAQLQDLLIHPWQESEAARLEDRSTPPHYLIIIDALDEIDGDGGTQFLRDLLEVIKEHDLQGLKFFATSRPDPDLIAYVETFEDKQLYRLEQVPPEEADADIRTYLKLSLPHIMGRQEVIDKLVAMAAGLFIYATTILKYLHSESFALIEQEALLEDLFATSTLKKSSDGQTPLLDQLYLRILEDAFRRLHRTTRDRRLQILHTFLCTAERTSTSVVAHLLTSDEVEDYTEIADKVLKQFHAVLYTKHNQVLWYHKSFPDFLFDQARSGEFWCDQAHHRYLINSCFLSMKTGLRFNIADIPSSFLLDRQNSALPDKVKQNIPPALSYSCRHWDHHLSAVTSTASDPLFDTMSDFLHLRVLFWIEAMNLLDWCGQCDPILRRAYKWVKPNDSLLAERFSKAATFALYFSGSAASLSTPHLYISALATWPRNLEPCRGWKYHFPRIPRFTNASRNKIVPLVTITVGSELTAITVSKDGRQVVSGSYDGLVRMWDVSTGNVVQVMKGHTAKVLAVSFLDDGRRIVSASLDRSVRVWDTLTGVLLNVVTVNLDICFDSPVAFSSDGRRLVSGSSSSVSVRDTLTGEVLKVLKDTHKAKSVACSNDGRRVISSSGGELQVWYVRTGKVRNLLKEFRLVPQAVAISGDGTRTVSFVHVWDVLTGCQLNQLEEASMFVSVAFSSDGRRIVAGSGNHVQVWDASTGKELNVLEGQTSPATLVTFMNDDRWVVSTHGETIRIWDLSVGTSVPRTRDPSRGGVLKVLKRRFRSLSTSLDFSSDDRSEAMSRIRKSRLRADPPDILTSLAFSSDDSQVVSGSEDGTMRLWNVSTGKRLHAFKGHSWDVLSLAFSSDSLFIVSGSSDRLIKVWNSSTVELLKVLEGHTRLVRSVAFSIDGKLVVSGSDDQSVRVWDVSTSKVLNVFEGHFANVTYVALSSNGKRVVSTDGKSVRVWDRSTSRYIREKIKEPDRYERCTGWLLSPNGEGYLMFLPLDACACLPDSSNIITEPRGAAPSVDFTHASLGLQWRNCYVA